MMHNVPNHAIRFPAAAIALFCASVSLVGCSAKSIDVSQCGDATCERVTVCGGIAATKCSEGDYCDYATSSAGDLTCGSGDRTGACRAIPDTCTREYAPVCGCDGATYANPCDAARSSATVAYVGVCEDDCVPAECPMPLPGCAYLGGTRCECGILSCP